MLGMNGVAREEIVYESQDLRARVLQHVMPGVREMVHLGGRKMLLPFAQEVVVEDEIPVAPEDQRRRLPECRQFRLHLAHQAVARVARLQRDVLHESDRKSTRLNSSHIQKSRMPSSA